MKNKNKKPLIYLLLLIGSLCVVGATIAYYTSSDTFSNEFNTSTYEIETQESRLIPIIKVEDVYAKEYYEAKAQQYKKDLQSSLPLEKSRLLVSNISSSVASAINGYLKNIKVKPL